MFTSKRVAKPKFRRKALYCYVGSNAFWTPIFIYNGLWFNVCAQAVLFLINVRGFLNIRKELK